MYKIGIHPDDYTATGKLAGYDAASGRWKALLAAADSNVRMVVMPSSDILPPIEVRD
jgi:hypothetical protein